jgi:succinyl-diaminopimelate desuccinylase
MSALRELKERTPRANAILLACPDEEVGGELGLGYAVNHANVRGDAAIVIDASPAVVSIGASGILWGKVVVKGKQGHAGYPQIAKNAIDEALPFLQRLSKYAKIRERIRSKILAPPGSPHKQIWGRFTLTMLNAGEKENIIPGECEARFDMRVCPDENYERAKRDLEIHFKKLRSAQGVKATLEFTQQTPSNYFTDPKHPIVARFARAASEAFGRRIPVAGELGGNDGHFFSKIGIPVISFGPIRDDCRFHGVDEFVYLKDIELVKKTLVNLMCDWDTNTT